MKRINTLLEQLRSTDFHKKYPMLDMEDNKTHLLYISPCMNGTGYYRAIIPALELNTTSTHAAIVNHIHNWDFNKQFDDYDSPVDERLIRWADYIILPAIFSDVSYILDAIKQVNNDLQFVMDIDINYHRLPETHPDYSKVTEDMKAQLLLNVSKMDILTGVTEGLLQYYDALLDIRFSSSRVELAHIPNLISPYGYEEVEPAVPSEKEVVKIGLVGNCSSASDIFCILDSLEQIQSKYGDHVEFVFFGWDGNTDKVNIGNRLKFTSVKSVSFMDYFDVLRKQHLDIALLPLSKSLYNLMGKSAIKFLELSVYGIPVVASELPPYSDEIKEGKTGLLAEDDSQWFCAIDALVSDEALRKRIGERALHDAWLKHMFTAQNYKLYMEIYT
ncbi:MAG: glycosyltransferase [Cyclobacteriaceae bacterium]